MIKLEAETSSSEYLKSACILSPPASIVNQQKYSHRDLLSRKLLTLVIEFQPALDYPILSFLLTE
jgi:hypothetical protein